MDYRELKESLEKIAGQLEEILEMLENGTYGEKTYQ